MVSGLISRLIILVFGTLYPAYASYKAVRTKNVKEYVKWMMYWIVFALFTCAETFADVFLSWVPFYYEIKIVFLLWLLSPATKGSSILYRQFVHPEMMKREEHIDQYIDKVKSQGYSALVHYGAQGLNMAVKTAMTGQTKLVDHLKKSYSMNDLSQTDGTAAVYGPPQPIPENFDEMDGRRRGLREERDLLVDNRHTEMMQRSASEYNSSQGSSQGEEYDETSQAYLLTQEYHGMTSADPLGRPTRAGSRRVAYNHEESLHYGTLPKRRSTRQSRQPRQQVPSEWR